VADRARLAAGGPGRISCRFCCYTWPGKQEIGRVGRLTRPSWRPTGDTCSGGPQVVDMVTRPPEKPTEQAAAGQGAAPGNPLLSRLRRVLVPCPVSATGRPEVAGRRAGACQPRRHHPRPRGQLARQHQLPRDLPALVTAPRQDHPRLPGTPLAARRRDPLLRGAGIRARPPLRACSSRRLAATLPAVLLFALRPGLVSEEKVKDL
jgi:hypothetical protein